MAQLLLGVRQWASAMHMQTMCLIPAAAPHGWHHGAPCCQRHGVMHVVSKHILPVSTPSLLMNRRWTRTSTQPGDTLSPTQNSPCKAMPCRNMVSSMAKQKPLRKGTGVLACICARPVHAKKGAASGQPSKAAPHAVIHIQDLRHQQKAAVAHTPALPTLPAPGLYLPGSYHDWKALSQNHWLPVCGWPVAAAASPRGVLTHHPAQLATPTGILPGACLATPSVPPPTPAAHLFATTPAAWRAWHAAAGLGGGVPSCS